MKTIIEDVITVAALKRVRRLIGQSRIAWLKPTASIFAGRVPPTIKAEMDLMVGNVEHLDPPVVFICGPSFATVIQLYEVRSINDPKFSGDYWIGRIEELAWAAARAVLQGPSKHSEVQVEIKII